MGAFAATWRDATFDPARFFRAMPREAGSGAPIVYYLMLGVLTAGIQLFWDTVLTAAGWQATPPWAAELGIQGAWLNVIGFLLSPVLLILMLLLTAGVVHLLLMLFGGARGGFDRTLQVFSYAYSPQVFLVVPYLGAVVAFFWMTVISIIGLREAHQAETWRAVLAVLLPMGVFLFLVIVAGVIVALSMPVG